MFQVSNAIVAGVRRVFPDAEVLISAMADGGDGTLEVLMRGTGGRTYEDTVTGPLGEPVEALWGVLGSTDTAVVEMANASGLALVPRNRRDPLVTTTYGTGELIRRALDNGYRKFILGVGGSATCDGGAGVAKALGVRFLDESGAELPFGGGPMARLAKIDVSGIDPRATESTFQVATDVTNPLCGPEGTAAIYGPQKGATPAIIDQLDAAMGNFADVVRRDFGIDQRDDPGAGAAGGLAYGMKVFFPTELRAGVEVVADAVKFVEQLDGRGPRHHRRGPDRRAVILWEDDHGRCIKGKGARNSRHCPGRQPGPGVSIHLRSGRDLGHEHRSGAHRPGRRHTRRRLPFDRGY